MKEIAINFNANNAYLIAEGIKKAHRSPITVAIPSDVTIGRYTSDGSSEVEWALVDADGDPMDAAPLGCPYGNPGDVLWVREPWQLVDPVTFMQGGSEHTRVPKKIPRDYVSEWMPVFAAKDFEQYRPEDRGFSWRPGIQMPRWICRLRLPITSIEVERVQSITEEGARLEGYKDLADMRDVWGPILDKINSSWEKNPWVWRVEWDKPKGPYSQ